VILVVPALAFLLLMANAVRINCSIEPERLSRKRTTRWHSRG
jgi:hypothetical protein